MGCQPLRRANLILPAKTSRIVGCEFDVVRGISVDEIFGLDLERVNIQIRKCPTFKQDFELREVSRIRNRLMRTKRHIEFAALVETAKSVEAGAIQVIEELSRFGALPFAIFDQFIKPIAVPVKALLFILHLDCYVKATLQVSVKIYEMRIDVIQQSALWSQTQRRGESAAERLNVAPGRMRLPKRREVRQQPTLSSRPL